jgi:hypothetical protein
VWRMDAGVPRAGLQTPPDRRWYRAPGVESEA